MGGRVPLRGDHPRLPANALGRTHRPGRHRHGAKPGRAAARCSRELPRRRVRSQCDRPRHRTRRPSDPTRGRSQPRVVPRCFARARRLQRHPRNGPDRQHCRSRRSRRSPPARARHVTGRTHAQGVDPGRRPAGNHGADLKNDLRERKTTTS